MQATEILESTATYEGFMAGTHVLRTLTKVELVKLLDDVNALDHGHCRWQLAFDMVDQEIKTRVVMVRLYRKNPSNGDIFYGSTAAYRHLILSEAGLA